MEITYNSAMADDKKIYFCVTLNAERTSVVWDFSEQQELQYHKLVVKQVTLGAGANVDEYNIIVVNTAEREDLKIPIAILKANEIYTGNPDMEFNSKVQFTLIEGNGPVHIYGHLVTDDDYVNYVDDDANNYGGNSRSA